MKNVKVISSIFLSGILGVFLTGCKSVSEPPANAQVFAVLTAQNAQVTRDASVTIQSLDAAAASDGKGAVTVNNIYTPTGVSGTDITFSQGGSVTFENTDLYSARGNSFVLAKPAVTTVIGGTTFTTTQVLVVGGARRGMQYGDYGYWRENTVATGAFTGSYANWAPFVIFDPANASANVPTTDNTNYTFSGRMLGGLDLYDVSNKLVETDEVTGDITVNVNFRTNKLSGTMAFFVNDMPWYTGAITSTGGVQTTDDSFAGTITLNESSYSGRLAVTSGSGAGYNTALTGQFLGKSGQIPAEAVGQFNIICNPGSVNNFGGEGLGFRPEVYGSFGVKR